MPIYDYLCPKCKAAIAVIRPAADYRVPPTLEEGQEASATNPEDASHTPCEHDWERHISGGNFQLAGRGWASTGYQK
jgi:hypothetical protein